MFPFIVADIGGTNARFALATGKDGQKFTIEEVNILSGADFSQFSDALTAYIDGLNGVKPTGACVAIAGPIDGDKVKMTNLSWEFSKKGIQEAFGFSTFDVINDFAAVAVATSIFPEDVLTEIKPGEFNPKSNKAIIGAGTGLGVACLAYNPADDSWLPMPSEGGHVNMAPATEFEADVVKAAIKRFGHASAEVLVSGPGLVNLYQCICDVKGETPKEYSPADISGNALSNDDDLCRLTLETFCAFLGTVSGNIVLTYGAKGGVYVAGGIVPRFVDFLKESAFAERFKNKGIMSHYVENQRVVLMDHDHTAFLGAAAWYSQIAK